MPASKTLLTGPHGAALREALLRGQRPDPSGLWLVPTTLAKAQVLASLGRRWKGPAAPRAWTWGDLWAAVRAGVDEGPVVLSDAASRAVLIEAIGQARRSGELSDGGASTWPGFRRRARRQVAAWSRREQAPDESPSDDGPESDRSLWAIYVRYRRALDSIGAVDAEGLATWASEALVGSPPPGLKRLGTVTVIDLDDDSIAARRALRAFESRARAVRVSVAFAEGQSHGGAASGLRQRLIDRGYAETTVAEPIYRPLGLVDLERNLFRDDPQSRPPLTRTAGLRLLGGPQGEGLGLLVAREVHRALDDGLAPEDVLVLVPRWDSDAEAVLRTMRSWGLPVSAVGRSLPLASSPAVNALRLALSVVTGGWEADGLVRLLRHGRFHPDWQGLRAPNLAARAAAAVRDGRALRGLDQLRVSLRASEGSEPKGGGAPLAREARELAGKVLDLLDAADRSGAFADHVERLRRLSTAFGFDRVEGEDGDALLERFWESLDDHGDVLADLGVGDARLELRDFAEAVSALADDLSETDRLAPGALAMAEADQGRGARAKLVVLANLAEGTFPSPAASARAGENERAYQGEVGRFLRVIGSADDRLVLAFPTRDAKGQDLAPSGFLEDLRRLYSPEALAAVEERHGRFDPALVGHEDLAVAPADARVRAVAVAVGRRELRPIGKLAADPASRGPLVGAAIALGLGHQRTTGRVHTPYEGKVVAPPAVAAVAERFGPGFAFTASQLESYLYCPFQFFMRYVLKLKPVDESDELEDDFAGFGTRIHKVLELLERKRKAEGGDREALFGPIVDQQFSAEDLTQSDVDAGKAIIEHRRLQRTVQRYLAQAQVYEGGPGEPPRPEYFEVDFGMSDNKGDYGCLMIGDGEAAVKVRGTIDRIDVVESGGPTRFRVIDYKSGVRPTDADIQKLNKLQLPIYALAAQRLVLAEKGAVPDEVGYWSLRDEQGYKKAKVDWEESHEKFESKVIKSVGDLRAGEFVINPKSSECASRCDFSGTCRVSQVRRHRDITADDDEGQAS